MARFAQEPGRRSKTRIGSQIINRFLRIPSNHPVFEIAVARRELKRLMTQAGWSAEPLNSFRRSRRKSNGLRD
jgi:hypothetical protein